MTTPDKLAADVAELERLEETDRIKTWHIDERVGIVAAVSEVSPNGYQGLHADSFHVILYARGFHDIGSGGWSVSPEAINACRLAVAARNALPALLQRLRELTEENTSLWKQHMAVLSHDDAELKVLELRASNARLLKVAARFASYCHWLESCAEYCQEPPIKDSECIHMRMCGGGSDYLFMRDLRAAKAAFDAAGKGAE